MIVLQWIFGFLLLLFILVFAAFFGGLPILCWAGVGLLVGPPAYYQSAEAGLSAASKALRSLLIGPVMALGALGLFAPLRAMGVWLWLPFAESEKGRELGGLFLIRADHHALNAAIGACGLGFALWAGFIGLGRLAKMRSQLENLPRTKASSAAMGLAEFSGIVRRVEGPRATQEPWQDKDPGNNVQQSPEADAVLWKGWTGAGFKILRKRFYLEDESGRILIDPAGVDFRDHPAEFAVTEMRLLLLARGRRYLDRRGLPNLSIDSLLEGQEVYVIGTVQADEQGQAGELKVAPAKRALGRGLYDGLFPSRYTQDPAAYADVFLVSDGRESLTRLHMQKSRWRMLAAIFAWMGVCGTFMVSEMLFLTSH